MRLLTLVVAVALAVLAPPALAWERTVDGPASGADTVAAAAVDAAGNVAVAGAMEGAGGSPDFAVLKLSGVDGTPLWAAPATFDGSAAGEDRAEAVAVDAAGDVIAAGTLANTGTGRDLAVVKLAGATGALVWAAPATVNGTAAGSTDEATAVAVDAAGDVIAAGFTQNASTNLDLTVVKLAGATGAPRWAAPVTIDGTAHGGDLAFALALDAAGDVVVAGTTQNVGTSLDFTVVKLAGGSGAELWRRSIAGTTGGGVDQALAVAVDPAGDVAAAGFSQNAGTAFDLTVVRLSGSTGTLLWPQPVKLSGAVVGSEDQGNGVAVDASGNVVATGLLQRASDDETVSDFVVVKLAAANGVEVWRRTVAGGVADSFDAEGVAVAVDPGGNALAGGRVENAATGTDFALVRLAAADGVELVRRTLGGSAATSADAARAVAVDRAGNLVGAGTLGNAATGTDIAVVKIGCTGGEPLTCPGPEPCYDAVCEPAGDVCVVNPEGTPCSDGDPCTQTDACRDGACAPADLEVVRCELAIALADPACAADRLPRAVKRGLKRTRRLVDKAEAASEPAKRVDFASRARTRLGKVGTAIDRATTRRRRPLSAGCAAALRAVVADGLARLERLRP